MSETGPDPKHRPPVEAVVKVYLAVVQSMDDLTTQVCATREDALHWLARVGIPEEGWVNFFDALDEHERPGATRDRSGMTDEEVLALWAEPDPDLPDTWGYGADYGMTIEEQDVYRKEPTDG